MQRRLYSPAWHGTVATMPGWEAYIWQHLGRRLVILSATCAEPPWVQAERFLHTFGARPTEVLVETSFLLEPSTEQDMHSRGWTIGYVVPVHLLPVGDPAWRAGLRELPADWTIREVTDEEGLSEYAWVQDQAYRETYDLPRGCASLFYSSLAALCNPDTIAALLYDNLGRPVRAACLVRAGGLVSGIGGAAVPRVRGNHLGEPLMRFLGLAAVERFGAPEVVHITMPVARPIAVRLGLEVVDVYRRWVPGSGVGW